MKNVKMNGHEYVDLGLPSGLLWATYNVGANKPEEYGDYYTWGEIKPCGNCYKWKNNNSRAFPDYGITKYNTTDGKTVLELEDDAARANWGGDWRMPTEAEQDELRTECTWTWITGKNSAGNAVAGYKITGTNGNSIFLPAAGCRYGSSLNLAGAFGYYWSSSLNTSYPDYACNFNFNSVFYVWNIGTRYSGQSIRAVCSS